MAMTLTAPRLTADRLAEFHENGYLVVDGLFAAEEIEAIEQFFENYKNAESAFGGKTLEEVDRHKGQVRAMHPHRHSDQALDWALKPSVLAVLEQLFEAEPLLAQTMYYYKPPGTCGQGMHQDDFYLLTKPHHCLAAWTAIDDSESTNGCLYVVPGSHRQELRCPEGATPENKWKFGVLSLAESTTKAVPLPVRRGQTLFFGGGLIHGSCPNRTKDRWRRTFIGHYCDGVTESISRFYHPIIDKEGEVISRIEAAQGGGPCEGGWEGAVH